MRAESAAKERLGNQCVVPRIQGLVQNWGRQRELGSFSLFSERGWGVGWIVRLVEAGAEGSGVEIVEITKPDDLGDIANLGLTLAEAKQLLAGIQREISSAQAKGHAIRRPVCPCSDGVCQVKDYRDHSVATLFGQVTMRLARFRCAACGRTETGINWPSHCRSTPELDRLRAHLSALMTYRVGADLLEQMFPVDAGIDPRTLRRHTLKAGAALAERAAIRPPAVAPAITVTVDSTFIRSREDEERHFEVRGRQCRNEGGRPSGFRRRREGRDGHRRADQEKPRCGWWKQGHRADGFHRWLSWAPGHSCRCGGPGTADS